MFDEHTFIENDDKYVVSIGNDVWIGSYVLIMDGVTIGDGAVIGLGSLVNKDIEPYSINVGFPAKKVDYRFSKDEIDFLLRFKWWDKDISWIKEHYNLFNDYKNFFKAFLKE